MFRTTLLVWLLPRHLRSSWAMLSIVFVGVLAAVTLMAIGAIYSRALAEGGLQHVIATTAPTILDVRLTIQNRPLGPADYESLRMAAEQIIDDHLSFLVRDTQRHGRAQPVLPLVVDTDAPVPFLGGPIGRPFFLTDFEEHTRLSAGRWPEGAPVLHEKGVDLEAVVGREAARLMGIEADSEVFLAPFRDDPSERINIKVVGLIEPITPDEEYWLGGSYYFFALQDYGDSPVVPFYVTESTYFDGLGRRYPSLVGDYEWFIYTDTGVLTVDLVQPARDALNGLETEINQRFPRSTVLTLLENSRGTGLLATYQRNLALARVPVFLFLSLVVMVTLYFLAVVVGLLAQTRGDEASLLRSRGADLLQVIGLLISGEAIAVLIATGLGPFLALVLARQFVLKTISPLGGGDTSSVGLSPDMFVLAAAGGLLSMAVLLISGVGLARLGILEFLGSRARPATVPLLHRYYVDVLLVAVLGLLFWQIQGKGGFIGQAVAGASLELDVTLLLGPALILLVVAFLMLRILPPVVRILAWLSNLFASSWATFTLTRMCRDPLSHGSLAVIVMLAAALGVFGSAFQSTLSRSQREQALYRVGGDLVLTGFSVAESQRAARMREIAEIPGVGSISPIHRDTVRPLDVLVGGSTALLAIESVTLPEASWFRQDFSTTAVDLSELLVPLRGGGSRLPTLSGHLASGIPVPETAEGIGLWVDADGLESSLLSQPPALWVRLLDSKGRYYNLGLGQIGVGPESPAGWTFLEAGLPEGADMERPISLVSIFVSSPSTFRMHPGSMYFDDLTSITGASGTGASGDSGASGTAGNEVIEQFEESARWVALPQAGDHPDRIEITGQAARSGRAGLGFAWTDALGAEPRGILVPPGTFPLPAIGGPGFQVGQAVRIGVDRQLVPVVIKGETDYFPTITSSPQRFLVVSLAGYNDYLRRVGGNAEPPGEYWVNVEDSAERNEVIAALKDLLPPFARIQDRDLAVVTAGRDPLAGGGWNGLTILSIAALALAVVVTLGTHAVVSVARGRVDLTVARALGFSRMQVLLSFALASAIVAGFGMVTGGLVGYLLSRWVLGLLDSTASGRDIVPPVIFTAQPGIILLTFACLTLAAALAVGLGALSARRLRASDILRTVG
ncbi:MAG TPA: FtsX-like permease family protein [Dehalococcoidia bacterium]|nr:FtsX-like permease family protein [Dehalococcoidia bacterium]